MSLIAELEGMKFPDEFVTRFFFKSGLYQRRGRVLELGCGNANNLSLFAAYGWECVGFDISAESLAQGLRNFKRYGYESPILHQGDMNDPLPFFGEIDVLLMPSSIYYVHTNRAKKIISELAQSLRNNSFVFCRFRTPADYRYGKGKSLGDETFELDIVETSEQGCTLAFYDEKSMRSLLMPCNLDLLTLNVMHFNFDNLGFNSKMIRNQEMIIWGQKRAYIKHENEIDY